MNSIDILKEHISADCKYVIDNETINISKLSNKRVLVTGATGLIGSNIVLTLIEFNKVLKNSIKIVAYVRNKSKADALFGDKVEYCVGDISNPINIDGEIDYIIHAASQTSSKSFVLQPVETINIALNGTRNVLELAKEKKVQSFVYLSTMEVYGSPEHDSKIDELHGSNLNTMNPRNSYPESKRLCEALCTAYCSEYGVPIKVIRLTQTFGPGVQYDDGRVFAEFARSAIEGKDIVLHTKGETKRNYLYTFDAVTAILVVLLEGQNGEAYNAANKDTYCSIFEMAELVCKISDTDISVKIELEDISHFGYASVLHMNLDTSKLCALGWKPSLDLKAMYKVLIEYMRCIRG